MYAQECYHYRRPDTTGVTWLTPQQLDELRQKIESAPVRVREIPPQKRATSDQNSDTQNLLASAPQLFARARAAGLITQKFEPVIYPQDKGVASKSARRNRSQAMRLARSKKFWNNQPK